MKPYRSFFMMFLPILVVSACAREQPQPVPASSATAATTAVESATPEWFGIALIDVQTGETFTMNDYAGKVVLLETMAIWCPNCIVQATQVRKFREALGNPADLISVTLDVDSHEDEAMLKDYASSYGLDWHFAVAPILLQRALGNLYSAEYLNPPLSPMLVIARDGAVHQLEYGIKDEETLQKIVGPYLAK